MRLRPPAVTAAFALLVAAGVQFSTEVPMVEHFRLTTDLDGDGKHEAVTLSTSGTGYFQRYWIHVGAETFSDEFFAVEGVPKVNIIRIDTSRKLNQILVSTSGPVGCSYVILAFTQSKISRLLGHANDCAEPQIRGNGVETLTWQGFWYRRDRYTFDPLGTKLTPSNQTIYPVTLLRDGTSVVEVIGVARQSITLQPADCKETTIPDGNRVVVKRYDRLNKRYLLKGNRNSCGWMSISDLYHMVDGLPWAG